MNTLNPQSPFVWPEPRVIEEMSSYEHQPPFGELALRSDSLFGIVSALTARGVAVLESWLERNARLRACVIVMVYPACATREPDLARLVEPIGAIDEALKKKEAG